MLTPLPTRRTDMFQIAIDHLNYGKLAVGDNLRVPSSEGYGVTRRSKGLNGTPDTNFLPPRVLDVKKFERELIDDTARKEGCLVLRCAQAEPVVAEELPPENKLGFEQLSGPRGVADDLKKLPGVSGAIEKQLNDLGIFNFSQIAELSPTAAHNVGEEVGLPGRVDGWIARTKQLTAEAE
jgi:predicted flap endonuclease-1-like 5' DNA nuclease